MFIENEKKNYYKQAKTKTKIRQGLWSNGLGGRCPLFEVISLF